MSEVIKLLPDNIANQIAAGEVIQRPASVVKELIENAVDAGATKVELIIKDAGRTLIQIIDNGKGMTEMDARMCWERHATSKLQSADDLFNLNTKGFRGEALASIAAIAHVDMETRHISRDIGTKISIAGSKVDHQEPVVRPIGTSIAVKNLFFNVPARRNFLKSDSIETKHVIEEFIRVALVHPEVAFKMIHNGNVIHDLLPGIHRKRIVDLFGKNFNDKLVPIEEETDIVKIYGFVGKPEFARKTRGEQYFFVNNRFFKDSYFHHAVSAAYDNLIQAKTFPAYFIYLTVPTQSIDVNIHPTKTEIKFEDDRNIYSILRSTIKLALGMYNIAPTLDFEVESQFDVVPLKPHESIRPPQIQVDESYNPFEEEKRQKILRSSNARNFANREPSTSMQPNRQEWENFYEIAKDETSTDELSLEMEQSATASVLYILHNKYILSQVKSGMMLIHIRRAKERVLYDQLINQFMVAPIASQQLMFPIEQRFTNTEKLEWENNTSSVQRLGFAWQWNQDMMILEGIPAHLSADHLKECLDEIIEKLTHREIDKGELAHELIVSLSKAATGSRNQPMQKEAAEEVFNQLFACEDHQYCPRGKRIIQTITLDELNKLFI
jgi:DNA mismatch repair protein MutL